MSQASDAAARYARLDDAERCRAAGRILRDVRFSYVYRPDRYEHLLDKRLALRPEQIPAWVYADIDDPERIPEQLRRDDQGGVQTQMLCGGRGAGKGHAGSSYYACELLAIPGFRLEILGPSFNISMGVDIKGESGIIKHIASIDRTLIKKLDEVKNILYLVNGSIVFARSSEYPKSVEGENYHALWVDEPAELSNQGGENCIYRKRAEPGVRLTGPNGEPARKLITGTPDEFSELILDIDESVERDPKRYAWSTLPTRANIRNLDADVVEEMYERGSQEFVDAKLDGILLKQSSGALIGEADFAKIRCAQGDPRWINPEGCSIVTMAVDANHSDDKKSDEFGILIGGLQDGKAAVFADASIPGGPKSGGERIIEALKAYPEIDEVCVEDDKSMIIELLEVVLRDNMQEIGRVIRIVPIPHGNKSKKMRADPVAVEYQIQNVLHCPCPRTPDWALGRYEQQWKIWNPKTAKKSPDRVDAGVYLVTRLLLRDPNPTTFFAASDVTW